MWYRASALLAAALVVALAAIILTFRPLEHLSRGAPPVERLTIERVWLDDEGIHASVRAGGSEPVVIAQVQVDGAYRRFTQDPAGPVRNLRQVRIDIPYPWITGEAHHIRLVTAAGVTFEHAVEVAVAAPRRSLGELASLALAGTIVGVIPVAIGLLFFPALQGWGPAGRWFVLAFTLGLLVFLLVDTLQEGLEFAERADEGLKGSLAVWLVMAASTLCLLAIGRRSGRPPEGLALATFIAVGIGLHNLGEGLAIGASFAAGEVALASFLVLGFALHNVTEGIAIAAPLRSGNAGLATFALLAVVAGAPAIPGTVAGAFSAAPLFTALAFAVGAGAILQVIVEIASSLQRQLASKEAAAASALVTPSLTGFLAGLAVMYSTALITHG